tara:strand:- start:1003 stop:2922 length:1920 start_codon:yes stop_codon:yes gene_type:complete
MNSEKVKEKELHLVIVWNSARDKESEILKNIVDQFELAASYPINWDSSYFSDNLSRFYGQKLPSKSSKVKECGNGEFLLITFLDHSPEYDFVETTRGTEIVNVNVFNLKTKFRKMTGGGSKIHATNTPAETQHDLSLLLGINYDDYINLSKEELDKKKSEFVSLKGLVGFDGWRDLKQLFYVMNSCINYVVLRNFEMLPDDFYSENHGDIDFLVEDFERAVTITNAVKASQKENRVYHTVKVANINVYVDFRYVGDGYYDLKWEKKILKNKVLNSGGFFQPDNESYFYSLVYHVLLHKKRIADDYLSKINKISESVLGAKEVSKGNFDGHYELLTKYLTKNKYVFSKPIDKSVYFDKQYVDYSEVCSNLAKINVSFVRPYLVDQWKNGSGFTYFLGCAENKQDVFIKYGGLGASAKREYQVSLLLRQDCAWHFPQTYYYADKYSDSFVVLKKIDGIRLDQIKVSKIDTKEQLKIYEGLLRIINVLHEKKIIHRDVRPQNILIEADGNPVLIDFQFAIDYRRVKYKELKKIRRNKKLISSLGAEYARGPYDWDDAYSMLKIINEIDFAATPSLENVKNSLVPLIGKYRVISMRNNVFSIKYQLLLNVIKIKKTRIKIAIYNVLFFLTQKEKYLKKIKKHT